MYGCLSVCQHATSETLSVCTVDVGDPEPRTVVTPAALLTSSSSSRGPEADMSSLSLGPESDMSSSSRGPEADVLTNRLVVLLCNVKPTAVKGVQSHALLLTAYRPYVSLFVCLSVCLSVFYLGRPVISIFSLHHISRLATHDHSDLFAIGHGTSL